MESRRRKFLFRAVSKFMLWCFLVQTGLIALAMLIRAVDYKEELVKFYGFPQIEHTLPAGEGDYWHAIRYHKTTYYVTAVLVALCATGVGGTLTFLCSMCRESDCDPCPAGVGQDPWATYWCARGCGDCCECCGDCFYFCSRGNCPDCSHINCSDCPGGSGSNNCDCDCGGSDNPCGAILAVIAIVMIAAFILIGLSVLFMGIVTWVQRTVTRYFQIQAIKQMTFEYEVQDLSPFSQSGETPVPSAPQQEPMAPSAPPLGPITDPQTARCLMRDLQAVYGLNYPAHYPSAAFEAN